MRGKTMSVSKYVEIFLLTLCTFECIISEKERREVMSDINENILLKIYEEVKDTKEQLKVLPEIKKQVAKIPLIEKQLEEIPKMKKQLEEIPEMKKQLEKIPLIEKQLEEIPKMKKQLEEIPKMKKQLEEIPGMKEQIAIIPKILLEIQDMKQEIRRISGSVARIEVEHGEKLVALFDAFKINTEKIQEQDSRITKCEKTLEKHDDQIYMLNSKIKNA